MKLLTRVHFICLLLLVVDLIMIVLWGITYRGQWIEIGLMAAFFITPFIGFFFFRKRLSRGLRIYFAIYPVYATICIAGWFIDRLFFAIMVSPVVVPMLYAPVKTSAGEYSIRANTTLLGSEQYILNRNYFLLEKKIATLNGEWYKPGCDDVTIKDVTEGGSNYYVRLNGCGADTALSFVKLQY